LVCDFQPATKADTFIPKYGVQKTVYRLKTTRRRFNQAGRFPSNRNISDPDSISTPFIKFDARCPLVKFCKGFSGDVVLFSDDDGFQPSAIPIPFAGRRGKPSL